MKYNLVPQLSPDPRAQRPDRFVVDSDNVRMHRSASRAQPVSPVELGAVSCWRAIDANVTNSGSASLDVGNDVSGSGWVKTNVATPTRTAIDHLGAATAWKIRDNNTSGYHGIAFAGFGGTINAAIPVVYDIILRPVGGRHIIIRDAYDSAPSFLVNPYSAIVIPSGSANVTARAVELPDGYMKLTLVCPSGTAHIDGTYGLNTILGNSSGIESYVGDGSAGFDLVSANGYQYSAVTSIPGTGSLSGGAATLTGDGTHVPLLVPNSAAGGVTGLWQQPNVANYGLLSTTNATLRGYYNPGNPHTTAIAIYCELAPTAGATLMGTTSSGSGFSIGITPEMRVWVGTYNTAGEWTLSAEALNVGEPYVITTVYTGTHLTLYINGKASISNLPITFGTYSASSIMFIPQQDMVMTEMACFNTAITATQVESMTEWMLRGFVRQANQIEIHNGMLWHTENELRLSFAELHLRNDGRAKSLIVRSQNQWHSSALSAERWGPAVLVDGQLVTTMLSPDQWSYERTIALPDGARDIVIRDSLCSNWLPCAVDRITVDAGGIDIVPEPTPFRRILIYGDSVSCGANADYPTSEAWTMRLRDTAFAGTPGAHVTTWSCGGLALAMSGTTPTLRALLTTHLSSLLNGTNGSDLLLIAIGVNDGTGYYSSWGNSAATFWTAYTDLLSRIHSASPNTRILAIAPHACPSSPSVANIDAIRAQIVANAEAVGSWVRLLNLASYTIEMDPLDATGLHPTSAGQTAIYNAVLARLQGLGWYLG